MRITKYGMRFPENVSELDVELWCYAHDEREENTGGRLTRFEHFQNAVNMIWNTNRSTRRVVWNAWTNRMIKAMIENRYVGFAGAGSSGKSDAVALFMLVEFLSFPTGTLCLLLSTTLIGAKKRVWKSVNEYWSALEAQWEADGKTLPGKMVNSKGMLVGIDMNGNWSEGVGLCLIAADKDNEKEAAKKLKGLKAPENGRLRVAADEFSDLGESVLTAMVGNLNTNPDFKGFGMANPGSKLTPFGKFVTPKAGWKSLCIGMESWETVYGVCLSFDAVNSPRMTEPDGDRLYPWMPSAQAIEQMKTAFGEDSLEYWAQVRGMFCPTGMERTVWSETELLGAMEQVKPLEWDLDTPLTMIQAIDPGFTTGGDRSPIGWAECGRIKGKKVMNFLGKRIAAEGVPDGQEQLTITENVINQFMENAGFVGAQPRHCGFDATGGGVVFGQWLHTKWSRAVIPVNFGGAPIERRADSLNEESIYANRVTQLWVQPKALVREGQIRGLDQEIVEELCQRRYDTRMTSKTWVESKIEMKKRTGKSPDLADMAMILVEIAIQTGLLDVVEIKKVDRTENRAWKERVMGGMLMQDWQPRKSLVAMPISKRLKR